MKMCNLYQNPQYIWHGLCMYYYKVAICKSMHESEIIKKLLNGKMYEIGI